MKGNMVLVIILSALVILLASGCFSFKKAVSGVVGGAAEDTEQKGEEEQDKAVRDAFGISGMNTQAMGMQFFGLYATTVGLGGHSFPDNFEEGQGTLYKVTSSDSDETIYIERALLKKLPEGRAWWRLKYMAEDLDILYEYQTDAESQFRKIRFRDADTGEIHEYIPQDQRASEEDDYTASGDYEEGDWSDYTIGSEQVTVGAGTFQTKHIKPDRKKDEFIWEWWMSKKVPGMNVKYRGEDTTEGYIIRGELMEINTGYRTELKSY